MTTLTHANAMPAPTWGWLGMNDTSIELADNLTNKSQALACIEVVSGTAEIQPIHDHTCFDAALKQASRIPDGHTTARNTDEAEGNTDPLIGTARSTYQQRALKRNTDPTTSALCKTGMGEQAASYLFAASHNPSLIIVPKYQQATIVVSIQGSDAATSAAALNVIVEKHASATITLSFHSPREGSGTVGSLIRVLACDYASLQLDSVQTLGDGFIVLDDTGMHLGEGARVSVNHTVLGAATSYTGFTADMYGDTSNLSVDTSYLGARNQVRDFNYEIIHRGRNSQSNLDINGVLTGKAKKTLRGTIDLTHGCKGSVGAEQETVLLTSTGAENKTVPVILCDEDDVAGNHGATIGHVQPDQLFYLQCRGISTDQAEELFIQAKLEDAAIKAPNPQIKNNVIDLGTTLFSDFAAMFEQEDA